MTDSTWTRTLEAQANGSRTPERRVAATVDSKTGETPATDRQERIEGFDQVTLEEASVLLVGAGGIGGELAEGLVRKGVGRVTLCDEDEVDASNLNRQKFTAADVGANKAHALAENLVPEGTTGTELVSHPRHFQDAVATGASFDPDVVVCAPDNDAARLAVCDHFRSEAPVVVTGLDSEANGGYVFVQDETAEPCFQCYRPGAGQGGACPAAPAVTDPTKVVAGLALYAVDTVLMDRHRAWDAYEFFLSGVLPPQAVDVATREDCPGCRDG